MLVLVFSLVVPVTAMAEEEVQPTEEPTLFTSVIAECLPELPPVEELPPVVEDGNSGATDGSEPVVIESLSVDTTVDGGDTSTSNEVKPDPLDDAGEQPVDECVDYMYDNPPTVECEEGQDPCIQPYYRTTMVGAGGAENEESVKNTLALNEENTDASNSESTDVTNEADLAAQSGLAENTEMQETRAVALTAMPKTGNGGDALNYSLAVGLLLAAILVTVTLYRRRQQ